MQKYIDNGVHLGWLIDRKHQKVYVFRPNFPLKCLDNPVTVSKEPVLPGFVLELNKVW